MISTPPPPLQSCSQRWPLLPGQLYWHSVTVTAILQPALAIVTQPAVLALRDSLLSCSQRWPLLPRRLYCHCVTVTAILQPALAIVARPAVLSLLSCRQRWKLLPGQLYCHCVTVTAILPPALEIVARPAVLSLRDCHCHPAASVGHCFSTSCTVLACPPLPLQSCSQRWPLLVSQLYCPYVPAPAIAILLPALAIVGQPAVLSLLVGVGALRVPAQLKQFLTLLFLFCFSLLFLAEFRDGFVYFTNNLQNDLSLY